MPAVPLLAMSVAGLAVFYAMPARFNAWLGRLPGDEILRTALIFAPATLLAIVVMAVLYANDAPRREAVEATRPSRRRRSVRARQRGGLARASLWLSLPALMLVAAAHLIDFVAPERVAHWLEALPATGLITRLFDVSLWVVLGIVGLGLLFGFAPARDEPAGEEKAGRRWSAARVARLGALLILVPALGLLVLSGAGLAWIAASAERLAWLAERLPAETLLRLGLMFFPAMLLGLVLLAGMYLAAPRPEEAVAGRTGIVSGREGDPTSPGSAGSSREGGFRSGLALGVLVAGLGFTALTGMAVLVALIFVLAAR